MDQQTAAPKFKIKAHVTLPLLKVAEGKDYAVTIETAFVRAEKGPDRKVKEEFTDPDTGVVTSREVVKPAQEPPVLCQVTDLYTGKRMQMIAGSVFHSELDKKYPDGSYLHKSFAFKVYAIQGKRYKGVELAEVEVEAPAPDAKAGDAAALAGTNDAKAATTSTDAKTPKAAK